MAHHLIFEGAELAGKSWLMSQIYEYLENKFGNSSDILNGCHWFNADIGVYGTEHGKNVIKNYINIFEEIRKKNIIVEKLFISDLVYNELYRNKKINYLNEIKRLGKNNFKIVFVKFPEDEKVLEKRIEDRLNIYPHYRKILKKPNWYIGQQRLYKEKLIESGLDFLEIETKILPDQSIVKKTIDWM